MNCKSIIDGVVEARDIEDRRVGQVIGTLKPASLANIDRRIKISCDYMEMLVQKYEQMLDPEAALALRGDMMNEPDPTYEGLQATYALVQLYSTVLRIYRDQGVKVSLWGDSTPLIKLPGQVSNVGKGVSEFVPDIWDGRLELVLDALSLDRRAHRDNNDDDYYTWEDVLSPNDVRNVWDSLRPLIPTTRCINMDNMRVILAGDRARFAKRASDSWKFAKKNSITLTKRQAYDWATGHPGLGSINAGTELDKVSIFIDDLYDLAGWRPSA